MSASCVPSGVFMPESARSRNVLGSAFLAELKDLFGNEADFSENLGQDENIYCSRCNEIFKDRMKKSIF